MLILTGQQREGDPNETLTKECTDIVSATVAGRQASFLAGPPFSGWSIRRDARWRPYPLVIAMVLMAWDSAGTILDRFGSVRSVLTAMFPSRRRVGKTYNGLSKAVLRWSDLLSEKIAGHLRSAIKQIAAAHWTRQGFVAFAADGSRVECPRTEANEAALGCGGRKGTGPQFWLTTLWHMGTGLPWSWKIGPSTDAERPHLRSMLHLLPPNALLVADAGFTGYELFRTILSGGRSILIRVGSNVQLLRKLGYVEFENDQTVYLWPDKFRRQNDPPLVLRLLVLQRKGKKIYLLTNLRDDRLSDTQAAALYEMRWGVEVFYRSMKQTLSHRKMLSRAPKQAQAELTWTLAGLQLLGLLSVEQIIRRGKDPLSWSVASSLRTVRLAMGAPQTQTLGRGGLLGALRRALKDEYKRRSSKQARDWPHKKREQPPGAPKLRKANETEVKRAKKIKAAREAA